MAGGYLHKPDGTEGVGGILRQLQAQVNALRGGAGIRSAILRGVQLVFQNEAGQTSGKFGTFTRQVYDADGETLGTTTFSGSIFVDPATDNILFIAASDDESGSTRVQAGTAGDIGALDYFAIQSADVNIDVTGRVGIDADSGIDILTGGDMRFVELPNTGSASNLHVGSPISVISRVTSARKYKEDIADAEVDPADVLALVGRTWVDKGSIDRADEGDIARNIGFIAEELDGQPSLRQFVNYDEDGDPDSIEYDRLAVALLAVIKWLTARVDRIEAENAELRKQVADLAARVTRLESGGK